MPEIAKAQTPYARARQEWDERFGDQIKSKNNWRVAAFVSMGTTFFCVTGMVAIGYRSNTVPYVVALDDVGRAVPVIPAKQVAVKDVHLQLQGRRGGLERTGKSVRAEAKFANPDPRDHHEGDAILWRRGKEELSMATNQVDAKALDLENREACQSEDEIREGAQTDTVVRGVNGGLTPKARKLRPLAGLVIIAVVVLAAGYMRHGLANRNKKTAKQSDAAKIGFGPATSVEKGMLSDQARNGLDIGTSHVPESVASRSSIANGETPGGMRSGTPATQTSSIPPLEYRQSPVSTAVNGSLSFAEQRRLEEYNREREAMEAGTSVKGNLPSEDAGKSSSSGDPLQAIQSALLNARAAQGIGSIPQTVSSLTVPASLQEQRTDYERQNDQEQKAGFGAQHIKEQSEYLGRERKPALGKYEIKAGWLIPAVLEQQLNSDLPGLIRALVRENVYDTATGRYILLPAGSTLVGIYNSHVGYGQNALQAVWKRVIFPDGSSLSLGGFEGDDGTGAAGFRDQVDNHWGRILSGALLTSLFAAGIELSQGTNSSVLQSQSVGQQIGQGVGQQIGQLGTEVTRRNLNVQPTLVVRPGYRFFVRVEKDILLVDPTRP